MTVYLDAESVFRIFNTVVQGSTICSSETQKICFQIIGRIISVFGNLFSTTATNIQILSFNF